MTHEEQCKAWEWIQDNLPNESPWPLDYINLIIDERQQLRADLARVTVERDKYHGFLASANKTVERRTAERDELAEKLKATGGVFESVNVIFDSGEHDGSHHKQYALDQVLRIVAGDEYERWVRIYESGGREWDEGVAP